MKLLIFTEGTILMHSSGQNVNRSQRVAQSLAHEASVYNFAHYLPIGHAVDKLDLWKDQNANIFYLTSRTDPQEIADIQRVLDIYHFPDTHHLLYRKMGASYAQVAEKLLPDILIEDDCESIGGELEMTYPHIDPELKLHIKSIIVPEFGGIDHLPITWPISNLKKPFSDT